MSISIRGRPKASNLPDLIKEGQQRDSPWKCKYCSRSFLRKKNLTTHERTHTDKKPYTCNYPGCQDKFKQSGQLRTHERCHTGEKPFACQVSGCTQRFTHSNRKCSIHSEYRLQRDGKEEIELNDKTDEELQWLKEYKEKKENPAKRKKFPTSEDAIKRQPTIPPSHPESPAPSSSGVSSSSAQEEERIAPQMPFDSDVIQAARILCSFTSGAI